MGLHTATALPMFWSQELEAASWRILAPGRKWGPSFAIAPPPYFSPIHRLKPHVFLLVYIRLHSTETLRSPPSSRTSQREADVVVTQLLCSCLLHEFSTHGFQNPLSSGFPWHLIGGSFSDRSEVFPSLYCRDPGLNPLSFLPLLTHPLGDLIQSYAFTNTCRYPPHFLFCPKSTLVYNRSIQLNSSTETHLSS